jgi:hypothetical protein
MIRSRKATPFYKKGLFCVRLNVEPSARRTQPIAVGIDPGSKKEGFSVVSAKYTFLNLQADARTGIKEKIENRRSLRRSRRSRKTPCRARRSNRSSLRNKGVPPSTLARWDWKLRLLGGLAKLYPVTDAIVEDIAAPTKKYQRKWNRSFSPLEVGKAWFYAEVAKIASLQTRKGYETKALRERYGLPKLKNKMSSDFYAHCVDAWVLAAEAVGAAAPTEKHVLCVTPLDFRRRSLHYQVPAEAGKRGLHGGTRSLGSRRGSLVRSPKYGLVYLGGSSKGRISLHDLETGKRLTKSEDRTKCRILSHNSVRFSAPLSTVLRRAAEEFV